MRKRHFTAAMMAALSWPLVRARPRASVMSAEAAVEAPPLLLAQKAPDKIDPSRYLVSEKYDGVRAYWNGHAMLTRHGQPIAVPVSFAAHLPQAALDGELWIGRGRFEAVSAAVRRHEPDEAEWAQIHYMVYELPGGTGSFEERYVRLRALAEQAAWRNLQAAPQSRVAGKEQLAALLQVTVRGGGEGLVLHEASAPYLSGRSDVLLKLKPQDDDEAVVLAHVPGAGAMQGMLGALVVRNSAGQVFKIGTGFNEAQRRDPPAVGATISYRYRGLTSSGLPRFASFWRQLEP